MVCILNLCIEYVPNDIVYNSFRNLYSSAWNTSRLMSKHFGVFNEQELVMFASLDTFCFATRLDIDFNLTKISPSYLINAKYIVDLQIVLIGERYSDFQKWANKLRYLERLNLKIVSYCGTTIDISIYPDTLTALELYNDHIYTDINAEHQNLRKFHVNRLKRICFDKLPKLYDFCCEIITEKIECPIREFKNFSLPKVGEDCHYDDIDNISVETAMGYRPPMLRRRKYTPVNFSNKAIAVPKITEGFYTRNPNVTEIVIPSTEIPEIEDCKHHINIRQISTKFFDDFSFLRHFQNLEKIEITGIKTDDFPLLWDFVQNTALDVVVSDKEFELKYLRKYENIPEWFVIDVRNFQCDEDLDSLLVFVQKRDIEYFKIVSKSEFSSEWREKFNYINNNGTYYFTKKPHPGVIICNHFNVNIDFPKLREEDDHLEFYNIECLMIRGLKLDKIFISRSSLSRFTQNKVKHINISDCIVNNFLYVNEGLKTLRMFYNGIYDKYEFTLASEPREMEVEKIIIKGYKFGFAYFMRLTGNLIFKDFYPNGRNFEGNFMRT
jgi:hypothetical protein